MAERRLWILGTALLGAAALFLAWNLRAPVEFILGLRVTKLAALVVVGAATGAATVLFQTVAGNRLITPGIVGFDALFVFLQTMLVLALGGLGYASLPGMEKFLLEAACLVISAVALFGVLLRKGAGDVIRMILTGVVLGVLLRGLAGFAQRILEPSEFAIVQQSSFASFGAVARQELAVAGVLLLAALAGAMRLAPSLDVAALGRTKARTLGLDYDRLVLVTLSLVAAMIAVSTALVGPVTFLGLLAASLAYGWLGTPRHALLIPAASAIGALILVAGQFVFERLLDYQSTLAVIVEFAGGLLFLFLVLRRPRP
ncbi:iron chelate uptake ABC transporter family permease subunit [Histidinibacterium aquaticum]|uniref:Iron chelate uptake ABC transporter family permease subunit n=1 Tax=Histidinibacterium aquaticum TaxID=2613962 RepID=A0A5J5GI42_9RHOB|nr:iron chelate uptake ABC transporter family permease subunit [Histidinibacterium aquaticum]KAA9007825.1 iron chelate uptake ABC transporter family permease subunit [Histidinibacterium aquaticum]